MKQHIFLMPNQLKLVREILSKHLSSNTDRAYAFGSRTSGAHRAHSDLDIAIKSDRSLPRATIAKIAMDLEESNLPYSVDVVDWTHVDKEFARIANEGMVRLI